MIHYPTFNNKQESKVALLKQQLGDLQKQLDTTLSRVEEIKEEASDLEWENLEFERNLEVK